MSKEFNHSAISIGDRVKQIRREKDLTQKEFADSLGIVQGFLSGIERGRKTPSDTLIIALCNLYEINRVWLLSGTGDMTSIPGTGRRADDGTGAPLLGKIPEGFPQDIDQALIQGYLALPDIPTGSFAVAAQGDYMAPTVRNGDLVVFLPGGEVRNGDIVLINNKWGEAIIRRYRQTGTETVFSSDNAVYSAFAPDPNTRIIGKVVAIWRRMNF